MFVPAFSKITKRTIDTLLEPRSRISSNKSGFRLNGLRRDMPSNGSESATAVEHANSSAPRSLLFQENLSPQIGSK